MAECLIPFAVPVLWSLKSLSVSGLGDAMFWGTYVPKGIYDSRQYYYKSDQNVYLYWKRTLSAWCLYDILGNAQPEFKKVGDRWSSPVGHYAGASPSDYADVVEV